MTTSVADVIADGLARAGTSRAFAAAADGDVTAVLGAVERHGLPVVHVAGPDVACAMAAVSGLLDGTPGAALAGGSAPLGLAFALAHRAPAVLITDRAAHVDERAKASLAVAAGSAAHWIAHACQLAMKEPWGPVHLGVPSAVAAAATLPVATSCRPAPPPPPPPEALAAAVRVLEASERPVVLVGRLCRSQADAAWVRPFAEARPAPVLATPAARGVVPDPHPLLIGTLDGGDAERALLASADLVVAIGVDEVELRSVSWPPAARVLHLTPVIAEPSERVEIVGDIGLILEELAPRLRDLRLAEWDVARLSAWKQAAGAPPADPSRRGAHRVVETVRRLTPAGTIAAFEGGDVWPAAARAWQALAPGEYLLAGGPVAEGFAAAAAVAAQLSRPGHRIVCFTDASAIHRAAEALAVAAALGLPVLTVVDRAIPRIAAPAGVRRFEATASSFATVFERALGADTPVLLSLLEK